MFCRNVVKSELASLLGCALQNSRSAKTCERFGPLQLPPPRESRSSPNVHTTAAEAYNFVSRHASTRRPQRITYTPSHRYEQSRSLLLRNSSLLRVTSARVGHATPPANAQLKLPRLDDPSALHLRTALQDGRCSTSRMAAVLRRTSRYFCASSSARRTRLRASSTWSRESQICRKEAEMAAYATTAFRGEEEGRFCRDTKGRYAS